MSTMLLSLPDLAAAFGVDRKTIRNWERDGKIPKASRTLGNHRRWNSAEVAPILVARGYAVPATWTMGAAA